LVTGFGAYFNRQGEPVVLNRRSSLREFGPALPCTCGWSLFGNIKDTLQESSLWNPQDGWTNPGGADKVAVSFSCSKGQLSGLEAWARTGDLSWAADAPAARLAHDFKVGGPTLSPNAACASAAHAIALGAQLIQDGRAEVVIAGAIEPEQPPIVTAAYRQVGALSKANLCRPFDRRRDGFVPGSGGGFLILEAESSARLRGTPLHGRITGWSLMADATHLTALRPDGGTIAHAIRQAVERAGQPQIGYINAHGTATKLNDIVETRGIRQVFKQNVPVSATKPVTGHLLGAAGAVEAVLCLLALNQGFAPPTLNLEEPDSECDLDYIPLRGRSLKMDACLSLNYGFGGHIGALVFEKYR
jgi:3-oxoacyl-[acyl-carrier-protein] synthase II